MGNKRQQCLTRLRLVFTGGSPFRVLRYMRSYTSLKVREFDAVLDPNEAYFIRRLAPFVQKYATEAFVKMRVTELVVGAPRCRENAKAFLQTLEYSLNVFS